MLCLVLGRLPLAQVAAIDVVGQVFQVREPGAMPCLLAPVAAPMMFPSVGHTPIDASIAGRGCRGALIPPYLSGINIISVIGHT